MRYASKVDRNQPEIVSALRKAGAYVILLHQVKNLFDILVAYKGQTYCIEVKDGSLPPSRRMLTPGEMKCKNGLNDVGVNYYVINSIDEALHLVTGKPF